MTVDPHTDVPDAREIGHLWAGLLLPPVAFLLNLELAYALVPVACTSGVLPVHLVHLGSFLLALAGGVFAFRCWRAKGSTWPGEEGGRLARTRFMAGLGLLESALFALVIVAQWIPSFLLNPCQ